MEKGNKTDFPTHLGLPEKAEIENPLLKINPHTWAYI